MRFCFGLEVGGCYRWSIYVLPIYIYIHSIYLHCVDKHKIIVISPISVVDLVTFLYLPRIGRKFWC